MSDILCLYYSRSGNTRQTMAEIAEALEAELVEFTDGVDRQGRKGYFRSGLDAMRRSTHPLEKFETGAVVDAQALKDAGIVKKTCDGVKILGNGALTKKLTVKVTAYSEAAKQKIEAAGGKAEVI